VTPGSAFGRQVRWPTHPKVPGDVLAVVQRQLDELFPAAFLAEWGAEGRV
jgi:hypothetical protein